MVDEFCYDSVLSFFILSFYLILFNLISIDTCGHFYYLHSYHIANAYPQPGYKVQYITVESLSSLVRCSNAQHAVDTCM